MTALLIEQRSVPLKACLFSAPIKLAAAADSAPVAESREFSVVANSGIPMRDVPHWGTLGINLSGIQAKRIVPALIDHDVSMRVGFYDSREITAEGLVMRGKMLKNSKLADQVLEELREGFPYEASVRLHPLEVTELSQGEVSEVNGHEIVGPALIFEKSELRETSIVTLGQDFHTSAAALSSESSEVSATFTRKTTQKPEETPMEQTERDETTVATEAHLAERARINSLRTLALPEQSALLQKAIDDGLTVEAALEKFHADLVIRLQSQRDAMIATSDASLSNGNASEDAADPLEEARKLPDSAEKFEKLYELDPEVRAEFTSQRAFVAFSLEQSKA